MDNQGKNTSYQQAITVFARLGGWIGGPVIVALLAGKYLDEKYQTKPWFFLGLTGVAFAISIFGLVKESTEYLREIEKSKKPENDNSNNQITKLDDK